MTPKDYQQYVQRELFKLAEVKYPDNPRQQLYYVLGFLTQYTAESMYNDSQNTSRFRQAINQHK